MKKTVFVLFSIAGLALFTGCNQQTSAVSTDTNTASSAASPTNDISVTNAAAATTTSATPTDANALSTDKARESYAMGMYFGTGWKKNEVDVDLDLMMRGIKDAESGGSTLLTQDQMRAALMQLQRSVMANRQKTQTEEVQKDQQEGTAFLAQNKTQPGVVTLPDGLEYKVITEGHGPSPGPNDMVTVNYRGTFVDGTEFDSSAKAGHPAEFPVRGVIPGWTEALEKMKVGSKWDVYIPSDLAYGPAGRPPLIGPAKTLIFEVELLSIQTRPTPPPAQPLTSDIIKVPSADEMKKGAQIETIKASDLQKMQQTATN